MPGYWITGGRLCLPDGQEKKGAVKVNSGAIEEISFGPVPAGEDAVCAAEMRVIPGLIDIHCHGAAGVDVMDASPDGLRIIQEELARQGVTAFLVTTMTGSQARLEEVCRAVAERMADQSPGDGARILGLHLEGPYINPEMAGSQSRRWVRPPDINEFTRLQQISGGAIRLVTLAPEVDGALDFIRNLHSLGITAAAGHSGAGYDGVQEAFAAGLRGVTHLFNAMGGLHHREPGLAGAALDLDLYAEIIADGVHVHPAVLRTVLKVKPHSLVMLVSDCVPAAGMSGPVFPGGRESVVRSGAVYLPDGRLAGSATSLAAALKNLVGFTGIPLPRAAQAASLNQARLLGLGACMGTIAPGLEASLTVLDKNLEVAFTVARGEIFGPAAGPGP